MNEAARVAAREGNRASRPKDAERFQQDAQAEINELQQEVQNDSQKKLSPIVEQLADEKGLQIVFNAAEAGIAWADAGPRPDRRRRSRSSTRRPKPATRAQAVATATWLMADG